MAVLGYFIIYHNFKYFADSWTKIEIAIAIIQAFHLFAGGTCKLVERLIFSNRAVEYSNRTFM